MKNKRMKKLKRPKLPLVNQPHQSKPRESILGRFGPIVGGAAHGTYRGDYFLDKDTNWR